MSFHDDHNPSTLYKILLSLALFTGVSLSTAITSGAFPMLASYANYSVVEGDFIRQMILFLCGILYGLRFMVGMFVFLQRKIAWGEGLLVSFLFFMMFYLFGISAGSHREPLGIVDYAGISIFFIGSCINYKADYDRWKWKQLDSSHGKLYTTGLFKYSMHINYFGDTLTYLGLAMLTHTLVCYLVVLGITLNFMFYQIPKLDTYLRERYTDQFISYSASTKKFIPFIY